MPAGYIFWVLMILWFLFGLWWHWPDPAPGPGRFGGLGGHLLVFFCVFLLGWKTFGFVVQ